MHAEVALASGPKIVGHRHLSAMRKHARDVAPALHELLGEAGWPAATIEVVAVDVGPGSYTGLRAGIVTAKTFAYATGAAVVGVDAMSILFRQAPADAGEVSAIVDAQQGLVYASRWRRDGEPAPGVSQPAVEIIPAEDWGQSLTPATYATGPVLSRYAHLVPEGVRSAPPGQCQPTAEGLWSLAWDKHQRGEHDDFWTLEPLYLRASSAQIKWDRRHGPSQG